MIKHIALYVLCLLILQSPAWAAGPYQGRLVDSLSFLDHLMADSDQILALMRKAGVSHTILSSKGPKVRKRLEAFAEKNPEGIIPLIKVTNRHYKENTGKLGKKLRKRVQKFDYMGLGDLAFYQQGGAFSDLELRIAMDEERVITVMDLARDKQWPAILRLRFSLMPTEVRGSYLAQLSGLLETYQDVAVVLTSMGGLNEKQISSLLSRYGNLYFNLSRTNPDYDYDNDGRIMIFNPEVLRPEDEGGLKKNWRELFEKYPDQFMVSYHNYGDLDWSAATYMRQTQWWRKALGELSDKTAGLIAYGNAQRLWKFK